MRILVVDDQAELANELAQELHNATGYEVFVAVGSQQAMEIAQQTGAPDVLITEVVLEGIDGFRLNENLREQRPDLRTIYVTAYDVSEYHDYLKDTPVFYKPAAAEAVAAALHPPVAVHLTAATLPRRINPHRTSGRNRRG